ncbi:hypothetical protein H9P43_002684 [Blastocladiella emersonii ATCC 22665]|nr:hypothetical protein H9P43_002684 [Blastocladiella emersonii ATCC 22665]
MAAPPSPVGSPVWHAAAHFNQHHPTHLDMPELDLGVDFSLFDAWSADAGAGAADDLPPLEMPPPPSPLGTPPLGAATDAAQGMPDLSLHDLDMAADRGFGFAAFSGFDFDFDFPLPGSASIIAAAAALAPASFLGAPPQHHHAQELLDLHAAAAGAVNPLRRARDLFEDDAERAESIEAAAERAMKRARRAHQERASSSAYDWPAAIPTPPSPSPSATSASATPSSASSSPLLSASDLGLGLGMDEDEQDEDEAMEAMDLDAVAAVPHGELPDLEFPAAFDQHHVGAQPAMAFSAPATDPGDSVTVAVAAPSAALAGTLGGLASPPLSPTVALYAPAPLSLPLSHHATADGEHQQPAPVAAVAVAVDQNAPAAVDHQQQHQQHALVPGMDLAQPAVLAQQHAVLAPAPAQHVLHQHVQQQQQQFLVPVAAHVQPAVAAHAPAQQQQQHAPDDDDQDHNLYVQQAVLAVLGPHPPLGLPFDPSGAANAAAVHAPHAPQQQDALAVNGDPRPQQQQEPGQVLAANAAVDQAMAAPANGAVPALVQQFQAAAPNWLAAGEPPGVPALHVQQHVGLVVHDLQQHVHADVGADGVAHDLGQQHAPVRIDGDGDGRGPQPQQEPHRDHHHRDPHHQQQQQEVLPQQQRVAVRVAVAPAAALVVHATVQQHASLHEAPVQAQAGSPTTAPRAAASTHPLALPDSLTSSAHHAEHVERPAVAVAAGSIAANAGATTFAVPAPADAAPHRADPAAHLRIPDGRHIAAAAAVSRSPSTASSRTSSSSRVDVGADGVILAVADARQLAAPAHTAAEARAIPIAPAALQPATQLAAPAHAAIDARAIPIGVAAPAHAAAEARAIPIALAALQPAALDTTESPVTSVAAVATGVATATVDVEVRQQQQQQQVFERIEPQHSPTDAVSRITDSTDAAVPRTRASRQSITTTTTQQQQHIHPQQQQRAATVHAHVDRDEAAVGAATTTSRVSMDSVTVAALGSASVQQQQTHASSTDTRKPVAALSAPSAAAASLVVVAVFLRQLLAAAMAQLVAQFAVLSLATAVVHGTFALATGQSREQGDVAQDHQRSAAAAAAASPGVPQQQQQQRTRDAPTTTPPAVTQARAPSVCGTSAAASAASTQTTASKPRLARVPKQTLGKRDLAALRDAVRQALVAERPCGYSAALATRDAARGPAAAMAA